MADFDLSKITGREPPTDDGLPCACEWNAAGEPVGLCAAHQSKLDDELAALRAENATLVKALAHERVRNSELRAEVLDVREALSAAESREVCTVAHDGDVATCGYCQRDALRAELEQLTRAAAHNAAVWDERATKDAAELRALRARVAEAEKQAGHWQQISTDYWQRIENLTEALERVHEHLYNHFEPDNQSQLYKDIGRLLQSAGGGHGVG